jgi:Brp/Blh family beta-carotene 15,15'-monooxygenase
LSPVQVQDICNWLLPGKEFFLLGSTIMLLAGVSIYLRINHLPFNLLKFWILQWSFILLILLKMPMLLGFGFYFSLWHSILTLVSLREYLLQASPFQWKKQVKNGITNSILAFGLIGFLIWFTGAYKNQSTLIAILFAGIAVLTAPHMLVISDMLKNLKQRAA